MFDTVINNHYSELKCRNVNPIESKVVIPHEPKCQRCEKRFSMCKCKEGFISTGSLMLDSNQSKMESV